MTSPDCPSGTARIASVLDQLPGEFFLNIQGDEPFIEPDLLDQLISRWKETKCKLVTAVSKITQSERLQASRKLFDPKTEKRFIFLVAPFLFCAVFK